MRLLLFRLSLVRLGLACSLVFGVSKAGAEDILFVQMSDTHVYDQTADFQEFSAPPFPWFLPDFLSPWLTVKFLTSGYGEDVITKLKVALIEAGYEGNLEGLSDSEIYSIYAEERSKARGTFGLLNDEIKRALDEVVDLNPDFVINTGDLILEGNRGSPDSIDRWFKYYAELMESLPMPVYNTIGNNELAGTEREEFPSDHPKFGKYFFEKYFDRTHYSFAAGGFHFIALDTHRPDPKEDNPNFWSFGKMPAEVSEWLEQELEGKQSDNVVILNHEPFHFDPRWPFDNEQKADDEGLFGQFDVDYVLTGHTHYRSEMTIDGIHHLTSGALSGMRWVLPASVHERGFRVLQSEGDSLYSVWKRSFEPVIDFSSPQSDDPNTMTFAAIDLSQPFKSLSVSYQSEQVPVRRIGNYFYQVAIPRQEGVTLMITTNSELSGESIHQLTYQPQEQVNYH